MTRLTCVTTDAPNFSSTKQLKVMLFSASGTVESTTKTTELFWPTIQSHVIILILNINCRGNSCKICYLYIFLDLLKTWQKKFQVHFNNLTTKSYGNFANRETCSFIGLQWCLPGNFAQGSRKNSTRAKFSRIRALVSNWHTERIMGSYKKHIFFGGGGVVGRGIWLIASWKLLIVYLLQCIQ